MVTTREAGALTIGATIGTSQTPLLRQYADKKKTNGAEELRHVKALKGFGTPSALGGIGAGLVAALLGISGAAGKGPTSRNPEATAGLIGYGIPALISGIFSGVWPVLEVPEEAAAERAMAAQRLAQRFAPPRVVPPLVIETPVGREPLTV